MGIYACCEMYMYHVCPVAWSKTHGYPDCRLLQEHAHTHTHKGDFPPTDDVIAVQTSVCMWKRVCVCNINTEDTPLWFYLLERTTIPASTDKHMYTYTTTKYGHSVKVKHLGERVWPWVAQRSASMFIELLKFYRCKTWQGMACGCFKEDLLQNVGLSTARSWINVVNSKFQRKTINYIHYLHQKLLFFFSFSDWINFQAFLGDLATLMC